MVTIAIRPETYAVAVTPATTAVSRLPSNGTNYTVDFTVVNGGSATDDFDLLTPQSPGTAIAVVSITGTGVTQAADPDSARVSGVAAGDTAIVTVTYSVADVAAGTADTLFFPARSVNNPATTDTVGWSSRLSGPTSPRGKPSIRAARSCRAPISPTPSRSPTTAMMTPPVWWWWTRWPWSSTSRWAAW